MVGISKKEVQKDNEEDSTPEEQADIDNKRGTNPNGMITFFMGGLSFMKGYEYIFIPIITIIFGIITYRTFDKEKEDNRFPFYIGILLAIIGLFTFITHQAPIFA